MSTTEKRVLHVEDNPELHDLVRHILARRPQIKLISALSINEGVNLARQHRPDLILMDIHLRDGTGIEALAKLRIYPETRDIPVVALSSLSTQMQIDEAMKEGFQHYLTKPIDITEMLDTVDRFLNNASGNAPQIA